MGLALWPVQNSCPQVVDVFMAQLLNVFMVQLLNHARRSVGDLRSVGVLDRFEKIIVEIWGLTHPYKTGL